MWCRSVQPLPRYGDFSIFKKVTVRHLRFLKIQNLTADTVQRVNVKLRNFVPMGQTVAEISPFSFFKDGRPPHEIFKSLEFYRPLELRGPICITM